MILFLIVRAYSLCYIFLFAYQANNKRCLCAEDFNLVAYARKKKQHPAEADQCICTIIARYAYCNNIKESGLFSTYFITNKSALRVISLATDHHSSFLHMSLPALRCLLDCYRTQLFLQHSSNSHYLL